MMMPPETLDRIIKLSQLSDKPLITRVDGIHDGVMVSHAGKMEWKTLPRPRIRHIAHDLSSLVGFMKNEYEEGDCCSIWVGIDKITGLLDDRGDAQVTVVLHKSEEMTELERRDDTQLTQDQFLWLLRRIHVPDPDMKPFTKIGWSSSVTSQESVAGDRLGKTVDTNATGNDVNVPRLLTISVALYAETEHRQPQPLVLQLSYDLNQRTISYHITEQSRCLAYDRHMADTVHRIRLLAEALEFDVPVYWGAPGLCDK